MKILNLYACLGGNRYKWGDEHQITAVELDPDLAVLYQERFPNDKVIVTDAHQYLIDHYKEFDFIWSSPPCPTHSSFQHSMKNKRKMKYPDMKLYEEIILLDNFFEGKYVVENVISYYTPLIPPKKRNRHYYWTNFNLPNNLNERKAPSMTRTKDELNEWIKFYDYDFNKYKGSKDKRTIARNLIDYEAGKTILDTAVGIMEIKETSQTKLF
jgi:DNA (cytosine-5)-methyltransferase 1